MSKAQKRCTKNEIENKLMVIEGKKAEIILIGSRSIKGIVGKMDKSLNLIMYQAFDSDGANLGTVVIRGNTIEDVKIIQRSS